MLISNSIILQPTRVLIRAVVSRNRNHLWLCYVTWEITSVQWQPLGLPPGKLSQRSQSRLSDQIKMLESHGFSNRFKTQFEKQRERYKHTHTHTHTHTHIHTFRIGCKQDGTHRQKVPWAKGTHLLYRETKGQGTSEYRFSLLISLMNNHGSCVFSAGETWVQNGHHQWVTNLDFLTIKC